MAHGASITGLRGTLAEQRVRLEALVDSWRQTGPLGTPSGRTDPVLLVRAFADSADRELAGLLAALFAYGRVEVFCRAIGSVLRELGPSPRAALENGRHRWSGFARGFRYRFQTREDLLALLDAAASLTRREGSLGAALEARLPQGDRGPVALDEGLGRWVRELRVLAGPRVSPGLSHLLADPSRGGAVKRWRLYLRWMIRPDDGIDCGAWSNRFSSADLTLPLDTHWIRMGPRLGLTNRRAPGLRMAREITAGLRRVAPTDPLRYDLPICHIGIGGGCPPVLSRSDCRACLLQAICSSGAEAVRRRTRPRARGGAALGPASRKGRPCALEAPHRVDYTALPRAWGPTSPVRGGDRCDPN